VDEYADMSHPRTITPEKKVAFAKARRRYLERKFPNLATDLDREIAANREQGRALFARLKAEGR
jgi:hypothetical protein